jgi:hypothetical protein
MSLEKDEEPLDISWLNEFDSIDNKYKSLYTDDLNAIRISYIYIDTNNDIELIKHEKYVLSIQNILSRNEIIQILKRNSFMNNDRYKILSLIKYNINLEPENLNTFLKSLNQQQDTMTFLSNIKNIDEIVWDKSIKMFKDLNELIIIFYRENKEKEEHQKLNTTKKIYLTLHKNNKNKTIKY